jgi:large subunit ribosomal protein L20
MTKVKFAVASKRRRKKVLKKAKGQFGGRSKRYRMAKESVQKGMYYSYRDRKQRKREFRKLWITRITAACRGKGLSYSRFMSALNRAKVTINRKMLAELALHDRVAFGKLAELAKK